MPYLTPDTAPEDTICRVMHIPNDMYWIAIVDGAVSELVKTYNFEKYGSATPSEVSSRFLAMYADFIESTCDMSGCCYDTVSHRVTSDGEMQISINGGDWIQDPEDPRITGIALPPPIIDETHTKCDAATNGRQHFSDFIDDEGTALGAESNVLVLAGLVAALIVAVFFGQLEAIPAIVPLIIGAIPALVGLGAAAWTAYWNSDALDVILCSLFCAMSDDGTMTQDQMDDFIARLRAGLTPGIALDVLINQINAIGLVGLNNMISYGESADADCSACLCGDCSDKWIAHTSIGDLYGRKRVDQSGATPGFIIYETTNVNTDGKYYLILVTDADDSGCKEADSHELIGSSDIQAYMLVPGDRNDIASYTFGSTTSCINARLWRSVTPFAIEVEWIDC